jgi:hypothetical protein
LHDVRDELVLDIGPDDTWSGAVQICPALQYRPWAMRRAAVLMSAEE